MFNIVSKQVFSSGAEEICVHAPDLAAALRPGQFVFVINDEKSRRYPFSNIDSDQRRGSISLVVGPTDPLLSKLTELKIGDRLYSISGPYGAPLPALKKSEVMGIVQGVCVNSLLSFGRYYRTDGNKITAVVSVDHRKQLISESKLRVNCDKVFTVIKEGGYDRKSSVKNIIEEQLKRRINLIYVEGDLPFCREVGAVALNRQVPVLVNLLPILCDCIAPFELAEVDIGGRKIYPAPDGYVVDARQVDFQKLEQFVKNYQEYETCLNSNLRSSLSSGEPGILKRLWSGLVKEKP